MMKLVHFKRPPMQKIGGVLRKPRNIFIGMALLALPVIAPIYAPKKITPEERISCNNEIKMITHVQETRLNPDTIYQGMRQRLDLGDFPAPNPDLPGTANLNMIRDKLWAMDMAEGARSIGKTEGTRPLIGYYSAKADSCRLLENRKKTLMECIDTGFRKRVFDMKDVVLAVTGMVVVMIAGLAVWAWTSR